MGQWLETLTQWLAANPQWLGLALVIVACMECLAVVGLIVPGTVMVFAIAVLAGNGVLTLGETLVLGFIGGLLGDLLSYALGRRFHQNIRRLPVLRKHPEWIGGAELYFLRYGAVSLLIGRFIGPLRPMLPVVAGMLDMPFARFLAISLLSGAGWSIAYLAPGWATGAALRLPLPEDFWPQAAYVAIGLCLLLGPSLYASLQRKRHATPLTWALSLLALLALGLGWPHLTSLDKGLMSLTQELRGAALEPAMVLLTRLGDLRTQVAAGLLLCTLLLLARQWRAALFASGVLLTSAAANWVLKLGFARPRPDLLLEPLGGFSFPSGHSSAAFAFCLVLGVLAGRAQPPRWRITWLLLACLPACGVGLSRIYLGVHWPSDVLGGALLAGSCCALGLLLSQWRQPLPALPARLWWLLLPSLLALFGAIATWSLPAAMQLYRQAG